ncbi:hypothetical protein BX600DRAFT_444355 [Xylariales sp. PMI_506]|nr:hypothetical protein BX600DRAFT_444355 [Xylariales sp. PMI_506]
MAPVTEIVTLQLKPTADLPALAKATAAKLVQQPGCTRVRYSPKTEAPQELVMCVDWESLGAHETFASSPAYGPFVGGLADSLEAAPSYYHVPFTPFPPSGALDGEGAGSVVTEVLHVYLPSDSSAAEEQAVLDRVQKFVGDLAVSATGAGYTGQAAYGIALEEIEFKEEKCRTVVVCLGWESVDAHMAFRATNQFAAHIPVLREVPKLKGLKMYHLTNVVA